VDFNPCPSELERNGKSNDNLEEGNGNNEESTNERLPTDTIVSMIECLWLNRRNELFV
jgi:hypothetical protein